MLSSPSLLFTRLVDVVVVDDDDDGVFFFLRFFFFFLFDMFEFKEQIPRKYTNISLSTRSLYPFMREVYTQSTFTKRAKSDWTKRKTRKESSGASEWVRFSRVSPKRHEKV